MDILSYFTAQSSLTDPGEYGDLYADLPKSAKELCQVIQGLFFYYKERYKYPIVNERLLCSHARSASGVLQWVLSWNKAPLTQARGNDDRFLASISDYANLFCSMARAQGTPARKRVGFVDGESFELAEYWDGSAWKQIDPSGLAKGPFVPAAEVWLSCRAGKADPSIYHDEQLHGLEVVRNNLLLDLAAMNKVELLNWDRYGWLLRPLDDFSDRAWETMDKIAALLQQGDQALDQLHALYASEEGVQVPRVIHCDSPVVPPHKAELSL